MHANKPLSRRGMLKLTATALGGMAMAACGATPTATPVPTAVPKPAAPTATKVPPTPAPAKAVDIQFRVRTDYAVSSTDLWKKSIANIMAKRPHLKIEMLPATMSDADEQKLITSMAAGTGPDLFCHGGSSGGFWGAKNVALPVDDLLAKSTLAGDFYEATTYPHTWKGKLYAIPWRLSALPINWRKDIFKEVGLDPEVGPADWPQMAEFGQKLAKWDGDKITRVGLGIPAAGAVWYFCLYMFGAGGTWFTDDFRKTLINDPPGVEALTFLVDCFHKYKVNATYSLASSAAGVPLLVTGQMAMDWANVSYYYFAKNNRPDVHAQWGAKIPPKGTKNHGSLVLADTFLINAATKVKDSAWEVIEESMTYENLELIGPEQGGLMTRKSWYEKFPEKVNSDLIVKTGMEVLKMGYKIHWGPDWTPYRITLNPFLEEAILLKRSPKEALDACANKMNTEILVTGA